MRTHLLYSYLFTFFLLCGVFSLSAQNEDTPNLGFERDFAGWTLYTGQYYFDDVSPGAPPGVITGSNDYRYNWVEIPRTDAGDRFEIMNSTGEESDPLIACGKLLLNPDGRLTARIGAVSKVEGSTGACVNPTAWNAGKWSAAEKMTYTFTVTPETALFIYKFAIVLCRPENDNHEGEQLPFFSITASLYDPVTDTHPKLECGGFAVSGDKEASGLIQNTPNSAAGCNSSKPKAGKSAEDYMYRGWTTGHFDLRNHIGKEVTIEIITHDCLVTCNAATGVINAGSHDAWGYFRGETKEVELDVNSCVADGVVITAPEGFTSYQWSQNDMPIENGNSRTLFIPQESINASIEYKCTMQSDMNSCPPFILTTEVHPVQIISDFDYNSDFCGGEVSFTDKSHVLQDQDSIRFYLWDFGDGNISEEKDPVHTYAQSGDYNVTLKVTSSKGCEKEITKKITVRPFPSSDISGTRNICEGESVTLNVEEVETGSTFLWNNGFTGQTLTDTPEESKEYSVVITDKYNCSYTKKIDVSVFLVPKLTISGNTEVCLNDTVRLRVEGGASDYKWDTGQDTDEIKIVPLADSYVSVTGIYSTGCKSTISIPIKIHPNPNVSIIGPNEICRNSPTLFEATGAVNYDWSDIFMGASRTINPQNDTIFTVTGVDQNGCKSSYAKSIKVKDIPELTYSPIDPVCEGEMLAIWVSGADTYKWNDGNTGGFYSKKAEDAGNNTYSVTGTKNDCSSTLDIPVLVLPAPTVQITGKDRICFGDSTIITAKGADSYEWDTGEKTDEVTILATSTGIIQAQVVGTGSNGCTSVVSHEITINKKPVISITGDKSVCENSYAVLTASGGVTYTWNNGITSNTLTPLISKETTFTVTGTNENACKDTATFTVVPVPFPELSVDGNTNICRGESLHLIGKGAESYEWSNGSKTPEYKAQPTAPFVITLIGKVANCTSELDIPVLVSNPPVLYIEGDSAVCKGTSFTLFVRGAHTYQWNTSINDTEKSISYPLYENSTFKVTGTDTITGCASTGSREVKLYPTPNIKIKLEDIFSCPAQPDTVILTASGGTKYRWSSIPYNWGINERANERLRFEIEENTQVFVEGESEHGCFDTDTFEVKRLEHPPFLFSIEPNVIEKGSTTVRFKGLSPNDYQWFWTPTEGAAERKGDNISHSYSAIDMETDSILVTVRNINRLGCGYEGEEWVYVWRDFWAPDAFSPNGDKLNDTFRFLAEDYIYKFSFIIFNRLGEIVFTGESAGDEWDGTYNGDPCPWGVYGWVVNYKSDYKGVAKEGEKKGFVTLVR